MLPTGGGEAVISQVGMFKFSCQECKMSEGTCLSKKTFNKQTFPALSHAIWQRILDVETSFDLGNPVKTFTDVCSSTSHTRTEPSHDEEAYNRTISKTLMVTNCKAQKYKPCNKRKKKNYP